MPSDNGVSQALQVESAARLVEIVPLQIDSGIWQPCLSRCQPVICFGKSTVTFFQPAKALCRLKKTLCRPAK
jgi:hypothetical protein